MVKLSISEADIEKLPNLKKGSRQWNSACPSPLCGGVGDDRFVFWPARGNFWCRKCDLKGFVTDLSKITPEQREAWQRAQAERERKQAQSDVAQLEPIVKKYHNQLAGANGYWASCGLKAETIRDYRLGFCNSCPTYKKSSSYVIPIYLNEKLVAIKHRLLNPPKPGDKYRYHQRGMKAQLFNIDHLYPSYEIPFSILEPGEAILVEGEIKTMYLDQKGFVVLGVPGASCWIESWGRFLEHLSKIFIAFDPGADEQATKTALKLSEVVNRVYLVTLPAKPDDFFVTHGGTLDEFLSYVQWGRLVR